VRFPLALRFKIVAIAPQISVTDASGALLLYVKQKAFRLKESVTVYQDEAQARPLYRMTADRIIDISARYHIEEAGGMSLGVLERRGMRSIWRAHYEVHRGGAPLFAIAEENPWVKLADGLVGEIPIVGLFTGYVLHPAYRVTRSAGQVLALRAVKQPALFESHYRIERGEELSSADETLALLAVLMMLLLERSRG
jgi:hypothetical protein